MNDKQRYYVSVQSGSIFSNQDEQAYELEIDATTKEVVQLRELFDEHEVLDFDNMLRSPIPATPYHHDDENDVYDQQLQRIYGMLYQLGTPETRKHIQEMGLTNIEGTR